LTLTTPKQRYKLILITFLSQLAAALVIAAIVFLAFDALASKSAFYGALCVVLPHCVFTWYVFRFRGTDQLQLQLILKSIYRGETLKFLLMALLVIAVLKHAVIVDWLFFSGLVFALILQVFIPILINYDNWD
jgi:ATP synthase protein I